MEYRTYFEARDLINEIADLESIVNKIPENDYLMHDEVLSYVFRTLFICDRITYSNIMKSIKEEVNKRIEIKLKQLEDL